MSAVASFFLIEVSKLNELKLHAEVRVEKKLFSKKVIDNYWAYLRAEAKELERYPWNGYVFADLFIFLKEKGIDLFEGHYSTLSDDLSRMRSGSVFIVTYAHRQEFFERLDPSNFSAEELARFNKEFSEQDDPELVEAELDGLKALRNCMRVMEDDTKVVVLNVG